ncbi:MAG: bifunctional 2-C-methyl-D-erythritol 4-phosphate cytidylyltransferase/2-C-methyl-D-erythritol 2,4-cyclodiphosphate synthase [Rhodospirillales bacterium]|nr:bifunctional 2-C-methyl-D-erythritol 4-phosphate cytidylyltransferase/2-C-methyl-D-erythritol 2,4-cyclodiphosphate synthase [Rhodospirillales bacterium]
MVTCVALVIAAGRGTRFDASLPKQYWPLGGAPLIRRSLLPFLAHPGVTAVRPVIHPDDRVLFDKAARGLSVLEPVSGGATRQESVRLGLESLANMDPDLVLIHDAARPFLSADVITRVIEALGAGPAVVPALPVSDTLKRADGTLVAETVDRRELWRAQTPQGFRFRAILEAHRKLAGQELTDDAAVAERLGLSVTLVVGSEDNAKITTTDDLARAERHASMSRITRTGIGFDVHRFGPGDHVMLGGLRIAHDSGLIGHSDADVALHALTDALLGALGVGDIGEHFPPTDPRWRGEPSETFARHAGRLLTEGGGEISNVDIVIICERPKIAPHRAAIVRQISEILSVDAGCVSVKATTTEKLGFTGRGEGIAAQAIATVLMPPPALGTRRV